MKRFNNYSEEDNPFSMSIGDLMSALLLLFILFLANSLQKLESLVDNYHDAKESISADLSSIDTSRWCAHIQELSISFDTTMFANAAYTLNKDGENVMKDFFPYYLDSVIRKHTSDISEIRIEGYSSPTWEGPEEDRYFGNMELSQKRSFSVLRYCESLIPESDTLRIWLERHMSASGLSYSHPQATEDKSRRVEFRIVTNSDSVLEQLSNDADKKRN